MNSKRFAKACGVLVMASLGSMPVAAVQAQDQAKEPRLHSFEVELDAQGRVARVEPRRTPDAGRAAELAAQIRSWVFSASDANASTSARTTFVRVELDADAPPDAAARVLAIHTGPEPVRLTQPGYSRADQRRGMEGVVVLKLAIDANGRVAQSDIHEHVGRVSQVMAESALASSREWRFEPETVAGAPMASEILWPVCFRAAGSSPDVCNWHGPGQTPQSGKSLVVLNPGLRLETPVAISAR